MDHPSILTPEQESPMPVPTAPETSPFPSTDGSVQFAIATIMAMAPELEPLLEPFSDEQIPAVARVARLLYERGMQDGKRAALVEVHSHG